MERWKLGTRRIWSICDSEKEQVTELFFLLDMGNGVKQFFIKRSAITYL
jgi:hypothetical protein